MSTPLTAVNQHRGTALYASVEYYEEYIHQQRMLLEHQLEIVGERRPSHNYLAARGQGREAIVHAQLTP